MASIARMEDGEIKSFESFLRIVRSLGKIEIFMPMLQEEEISPNEYYKMVQSAKTKQRKRASRSNNNNNEQEFSRRQGMYERYSVKLNRDSHSEQ